MRFASTFVLAVALAGPATSSAQENDAMKLA
jgi:hypothetical protein